MQRICHFGSTRWNEIYFNKHGHKMYLLHRNEDLSHKVKHVLLIATVFLTLSPQDLQYVIKLSFRSLWSVRRRSSPPEKMSIFGVIKYYYSDIKPLQLLEEENTTFLIIMDSFDRYQAPLDWEVTTLHTQESFFFFSFLWWHRSLFTSWVKPEKQQFVFR